MSKYTTEVRFICESISGEISSKGYKSIDEIINKAIPKVFDFDYPIFDEKYRTVLEKKILKHFYTREIGEETYALWKLRLDTKLNEIMPYFNKLYNSELLEFNPLYTVNMNRIHNTQQDSQKIESENIKDKTENKTNRELNTNNVNQIENESNTSNDIKNTSTDTLSSKNNTHVNGTKWDKYSDTPQGAVANIENDSYLTNARQNTDLSDTDSATSSVGTNISGSNGTENTSTKGKNITIGGEKVVDNSDSDYNRSRGVVDKSNTTENYLEQVVGYNGSNPSKLLQDYRDSFLNIDLMIIKELDVLFMQLW